MPEKTTFVLSATEQAALVAQRDHAPQAYLRERAATLLAIAHGWSLRRAARDAGLKPHHVDTVRAWLARYRADGLAGLRIREGRGRKPASFRSVSRPAR
jgi:Winged helix-turn helix